uniref:MFS transporter n=1 Tax=Desulfobacca acetoxidans TaxID=60893 RepID=A0A7C3SJS8_9BACT
MRPTCDISKTAALKFVVLLGTVSLFADVTYEGAQESVVRAAVADMVPVHKLGLAFGVLNTVYGLFWFGGSVLMGVLYDFSLVTLIGFSVVIQLAAVPMLILAKLHWLPSKTAPGEKEGA